MVEIGGRHEDAILGYHGLVQAMEGIQAKMKKTPDEASLKKLKAQLAAAKRGEAKFFERMFGRKS